MCINKANNPFLKKGKKRTAITNTAIMLSGKNEGNLFAGRLNNTGEEKRNQKQLRGPFSEQSKSHGPQHFWSEPALQLCKLGWIQIQILHNNLLSWSLAFRTKLSPYSTCVYVSMWTQLRWQQTATKHRTQSSTAPPELIKKTFQSITLCWPAGRVCRSVCPRHAKDSYRSDWETSCSAPAQLADKFKNSAWGNRGGWWTTFSRRKAGDVAAVEVCVKDDVREGIKSRWEKEKKKEEMHGCDPKVWTK